MEENQRHSIFYVCCEDAVNASNNRCKRCFATFLKESPDDPNYFLSFLEASIEWEYAFNLVLEKYKGYKLDDQCIFRKICIWGDKYISSAFSILHVPQETINDPLICWTLEKDKYDFIKEEEMNSSILEIKGALDEIQ